MLLKLALLLGAICAISAEIVEIDCYLDGDYCLVSELPNELPANASWKFLCPQNCTQIIMERVNFPRFPRELWITHPQVTYLEMDNTDFEELALGDFFHAAKLSSFELRYNKKSMSLRDNCFWGAFELISLGLFSNRINEVDGDAFNGIPLLEKLDMEINIISHIPNDYFRNLPNLRYLQLFFNSIETIESEAFLYNTKLNNININSNNLTEVDLLLPFINPGQLYITGNQITKIAYRSISPDFEDFDRGAFVNMENNELTELYIQPNFAVETLILWDNPIERIDALPVLRSLKYLNLERCKIKSLDGQRFADNYVNLERLHLTGNNLVSFSKETFAGLDKLQILWLDNNKLTEFPYGEDIRDTFPALKDLDISDNEFNQEYLVELVKILEDQGIAVKW